MELSVESPFVTIPSIQKSSYICFTTKQSNFMKKILFFLILSVIAFSCNQEPSLTTSSQHEQLLNSNHNVDKNGKLLSQASTGTCTLQDLYIGKNFSMLAVNSSNGTSCTLNGDQPPNLKMTSRGGFIYSLIANLFFPSNPGLYKIDPNPGSGGYNDISAGNSWNGMEAMAGLGSFLYAVQGGTLWRVDGNSGSRTPFSQFPTGWQGTEVMSAINNNIYIIQAGTLYRVTATNGSVVAFSQYPNGWQGTEGMAATNGGVFVIQGGTLWRVGISNGSVAPFSAFSTGWQGTTAMTAKDGFLYIVQGGVIWKVSTFNGSVAQLGNLSWTGTTAMAARIF
jgi:hypothetical protein